MATSHPTAFKHLLAASRRSFDGAFARIVCRLRLCYPHLSADKLSAAAARFAGSHSKHPLRVLSSFGVARLVAMGGMPGHMTYFIYCLYEQVRGQEL